MSLSPGLTVIKGARMSCVSAAGWLLVTVGIPDFDPDEGILGAVTAVVRHAFSVLGIA